MQNFDDLDIEGRNPSHQSEEEREKVKQRIEKKIFSNVFDIYYIKRK